MNESVRLIVVCSLLACVSDAVAEDTYFRCDGGVLATDTPLPNNFTDDVDLVWRAELLPGTSTPTIVDERIFLTTWDAENQQLATVALDRASGKQLWNVVAPTTEIEPFHPTGSPASATVASNGQQLFVFFGSYGLLCYDLDGNQLWESRLGPFRDEFGAASSPVLVDGKVVLNEDHDVDSFLIAIDQKTGETLWRRPREDATRSYSTPIIIEHDGRHQIVVAGSRQLTAYDPESGERIWWVNGLSRILDSTPLVHDGMIYVASWSNGGDAGSRIAMESFDDALGQYDANDDSMIEMSELPPSGEVATRFFRMDLDQNQKLDRDEWDKQAEVFSLAQNGAYAIKPGGTGDVTESNVQWVYRKGLPTVPSSVLYDGVLYMVKDSGIITSLDAESGQMLKQGRARGRGNYYASLVAGDGKVYLASERGVMTVLSASHSWSILSSHDFGERIMATPVVDGGRMFVRTDDALYCFAKKQPQ